MLNRARTQSIDRQADLLDELRVPFDLGAEESPSLLAKGDPTVRRLRRSHEDHEETRREASRTRSESSRTIASGSRLTR